MTPSTTYDPARTYVVQQNPRTGNGNVLVRGNLLLNTDGSFAYAALDSRLRELVIRDADAAPFRLADYTLVVVSLLDNQREMPELQAEFTAFGAGNAPTVWPPHARKLNIFALYGLRVSGEAGALMWMPVQGCVDAADCRQVQRDLFNFSAIVDEINSLMATGHHRVVYYHCINGFNRAGSLTACYLMKHMGRTRIEAMEEPPPAGALVVEHYWKLPYKTLAEWYAETIGK
ncbi:MAG: dual specificity protein phosphatase family protein [Deltaproteobacteria bacterium]|nr:dual specificity protein phosphatase family protein [Deltaproteobacteria bacterium]MBI3387147.1 dual specificity protein phosphatase family protein [Deltaproteobacteria bacterium]